jgi:predicted AAA+ superfamily ATPase
LPKRFLIEKAIDAALVADLIFELPHLPIDGEPSEAPFVYFRDSGLLRTLLNKKARHNRNWSSEALLDRAGSNATQVPILPEKAKGFWWEAFVIDAIRTLCRPFAKTHYWRRAEDEIDLVLLWSNEERWGVEITRGDPSKKPGQGFFRAADQLGLTDRFVVGQNGDTRGRRGTPCLDLVGALQRVMEGIARCSSGG